MHTCISICVGQLLQQHDGTQLDASSPIDNTIDNNAININDTIDDSMRATRVVDESTLLSDAM